jgi:hypothetical protein
VVRYAKWTWRSFEIHLGDVMVNELLIWCGLSAGLVILAIDKRRGIGALALAYFLALSLGHIPGLLAYLDPNTLIGDPEATQIGFEVTLMGMTSFVVGAIAARLWSGQTKNKKAYRQMASAEISAELGWRMLVIGMVAYFVVLPVSALVPSLTAITSCLGTLLILGFWLQLYVARTKNSAKTLLLIAALPVLPLATLATGGFIGFGTAWALSIVSFLFVIAQRRIWFYIVSPFVVFLGLSLFVTYYQQRGDIRETVWDQSTGMLERIGKVSRLVTDFELLDLSNERHLLSLDERLNQNSLVGVGVMRHREGEVDLLYGATLPLWALIPRAIWPDKPNVGGGGALVTQFTALKFDENTSVGAGQVLEFYANFGVPGVLVGFACFGFILMRIDQALMRALAMRDLHGLVRVALPGLAMLQPLGNLLEILVAAVSAIIAAQLLLYSNLLTPKPKIPRQTIRVIGRG